MSGIRYQAGYPEIGGAVAQLGERLLCKQEVVGSIPISSTNYRGKLPGSVTGLVQGLSGQMSGIGLGSRS